MREEEEYDEALLLSFIGQAKMHFSLFSPSPVRLLHVRPSFPFFSAHMKGLLLPLPPPPFSVGITWGSKEREWGGGALMASRLWSSMQR